MNGMCNNARSADLELAQCHMRLFVPLPIVAWYLFWFVVMHETVALYGLAVCGSVFVFGLVHRANVKRRPGNYPRRRVLAIAFDQAACFVAMYLTGELGAVVAAVNLWISLGNGIRFGVKWMALSAGLAAIGWILLGTLSDYWSRYPIWSSVWSCSTP